MNIPENAMTGDPRAALANQVNAFRAGRAEARAPTAVDRAALRAHIAALLPEQRAAAANQAEILAAVGQGLAAKTYTERRAILAHMGPALAARGVAHELVAGFDPSDANLASVVGQAVILRGMLGPSSANAPVSPPPEDVNTKT